MSRVNERFIIIPEDPFTVVDVVEKVNFKLYTIESAKRLCNQLQSMHHTIGVLLEELEKLKFPPSSQLNAEFDAQEMLGEIEIMSEQELYAALTRRLKRMSEKYG